MFFSLSRLGELLHPVPMSLVMMARPSLAHVRAIQPADEIGDAALVQRVLEGDRWAMEALYRRHVKRVTNAVTRAVGRTSDADDAVQEAFLIAFSRLGELRDPAAFRGWLAQIAMNEVRGRLRKRKWLRRFALEKDDDDVSLESLAAPDASPEMRAELQRIDEVLGELPADLRVAWVLRYVEGWELTEVATALDCSLATAKRRIKGAKDRIDRHIGRTS